MNEGDSELRMIGFLLSSTEGLVKPVSFVPNNDLRSSKYSVAVEKSNSKSSILIPNLSPLSSIKTEEGLLLTNDTKPSNLAIVKPNYLCAKSSP